MILHANPISQQCASGKGTGWIDREYANFFLPAAEFGRYGIDESAFSRARAAGDTDNMSVTRARIETFQYRLGQGISIIDQAEYPPGCTNIFLDHRLGEFVGKRLAR